jgi:hypothetical protein
MSRSVRALALLLLVATVSACDVPPEPFTPQNLVTGRWTLHAPAGPYQQLELQLTEDYAGGVSGGWHGVRTGSGDVSGSLAGGREGSAVTLTLSRQLSQFTLQLQLSADRLQGTLTDESGVSHPADLRR